MEARGWHIDRLQRPDALHAMVTPLHARVAKKYLDDLRKSVAEVRRNPKLAEKGSAPMYGMISAIPLRGMVKKQVLGMMKDMYGPGARIPELSDPGNDEGGEAPRRPLSERIGIWYLRLRSRRGPRNP